MALESRTERLLAEGGKTTRAGRLRVRVDAARIHDHVRPVKAGPPIGRVDPEQEWAVGPSPLARRGPLGFAETLAGHADDALALANNVSKLGKPRERRQ